MLEFSRKLIPLLQSTLASLFHPYLITKLSLLSPLTLTLHLSRFSPPSNLNQKIFSLPQPFSQFRLHQGDRESGSLVKTYHCFNLSFFFSFFRVQAVITGLTITDFLSFRLRKLMYCRQWSLMKILAVGMENHPIHLLSYPQPIVITSIPY